MPAPSDPVYVCQSCGDRFGPAAMKPHVDSTGHATFILEGTPLEDVKGVLDELRRAPRVTLCPYCARPADDRSWRHRGEELLAGDVLECFPVTKWDRRLGRPVPVTPEEGRVLDQWDRKDDVGRKLPRDVGPLSVGPIAESEKRDSVAPPGADNPAPRDGRSGPITAPPSDRAGDAIATVTQRGRDIGSQYEALISSAVSDFKLKRDVVEAIAARTCGWISSSAEGRALEQRVLEAARGRARDLEDMGTLCGKEDAVLGRELAYMKYGIRVFAIADAIARHDVPDLVAEIRRLRGWS